MGGGGYSLTSRGVRAENLRYASKSADELFSRSINDAMSPHGVMIRESRDCDEHPCTVPIVLALDVTGSMGSVPHYLVKEGLPKMMASMIQHGVADPQVMFLAIGDHECDSSPLQVGQFESSDELLDKWLTSVFLEGGGGGNDGESYLLAWYFAANHTSIDSYEKRGKKGFLFTIGDEPTLKSIPGRTLKEIMGDGQYGDVTAAELLSKASEKFNVYHLHVSQTTAGSRRTTIDGWKQLLGDRLIMIERQTDVPAVIADTVLRDITAATEASGVSRVEEPTTPDSSGMLL